MASVLVYYSYISTTYPNPHSQTGGDIHVLFLSCLSFTKVCKCNTCSLYWKSSTLCMLVYCLM